MTTLKVGIASYKDMKARTMAEARGERRGCRGIAVSGRGPTGRWRHLAATVFRLINILTKEAPHGLDPPETA